jgi:hypothetical protein
MSNLSFLNSNSSDLNATNAFNSLPTLDELLDSLGYSEWLTVSISFVLPLISFVGFILCSLSAYIFFQRKFVDPVFFYYRLLCITYIIHLLLSIPEGIVFSPRYFPQTINTYYSSIYLIIYVAISIFLGHFEDTLQMGILLTRMKIFSPFVNKHFTAKPQIVSLAFCLTCFLINVIAAFSFKITPFGIYSPNDNSTQVKKFYYYTSSDFILTPIGQLLNGFTQIFLNQFLSLLVGLILNIVSVWLYSSYLKERRQRDEVHRRVALSNRNQTDIATIHIASPRQHRELTPKELLDRKAEKNMFFMALTLCTITLISRVLIVICFVCFFMFDTFFTYQIIFFIAYSTQVLAPTSGIFVFYFFNNMFRQEFKKSLSSSIVAPSSAQR